MWSAIVEKLVPLSFAVVIGASLVPDVERTRTGLADGECAQFEGMAQGNDPSQQTVLSLCREGDALRGSRFSSGVAGESVFDLAGRVQDDGGLHLVVDHVRQSTVAKGWLLCSDDVFTLHWRASDHALVGHYVSEACDDTAALMLRRR